MLSDFLALESFYDECGAVQYLDDITMRYGPLSVRQALESGYLERRLICIGPDCGRCVCRLSEIGRNEALKSMH